jgi:hypothetical protein
MAHWRTPVTLRPASAHDRAALIKLAQLDSRPLPPGPHLLATREGRIDAAIALATGEVIADPFRHTAELCALLRCHAGPSPIRYRELPVAWFQPRPALAPT